MQNAWRGGVGGSAQPSGVARLTLTVSSVLQDRVSLSPSDVSCSSGVSHLEFSMLHRRVEAVSVDARLSGITPCGRGGVHGHQVQRFKQVP